MCYEVNCDKCGKATWGGCGRHVPTVFQRIAEGQHCMCRDWPGVKLTSSSSSTGGTTTEAAAAAPAPRPNRLPTAPSSDSS